MEFRQQRAIYLQIADYVCEKVLQKEWLVQNKIPSVRELAVELEVNPNTIVRTYGYLESQDVIVKQRGIGYFVVEDGYDKVLQLKKMRFLQQEMPLFIKTMRLLNIDFDELRSML
ncbi:MAG: GntR family transcriptional regulator [Gammaproteobacteria bacterium]|nr:GntR family transcriptional regulator [Gammaproteobacteria bacterium]